MFDYKKFGQGVRHYRIKNGWSQDQFSELLNIGPSHYNRIENGRAKPSLAVLLAICNTLNVSISDCLNYKDDNGDVLLRQFKSLISQFTQDEKTYFTDAISRLKSI